MKSLKSYTPKFKKPKQFYDIKPQDESNEIQAKLDKLNQDNQMLLQQLQEAGVSDKQIESIGDNRNFVQKLLNLKQNQGLITGTLALMNRPAEALQGILASSNTGEDVLQAMWNGLYGIKDYSLKDVANIELDNPLMNGLANMAFEVTADPFNYMNAPFKFMFNKATDITKNIWGKLEFLASKSENGQTILNGVKDVTNRVITEFKKTFGVWKDPQANTLSNDIANLVHQLKEGKQVSQQTLVEFSQGINKLSDEVITTWKQNKYSGNEIESIKKLFDLDEGFEQKLLSNDAALSLQAQNQLKQALHKVIGRNIEAQMIHGKNIGNVLENFQRYRRSERDYIDIIDIEGAYKTIDEARSSPVFRRLNSIFQELSIAKSEDILSLKKLDTPLQSIGGVVKDGVDTTLNYKSSSGWAIILNDKLPLTFDDLARLDNRVKDLLKSRDEYLIQRAAIKDTDIGKSYLLDKMIIDFNNHGYFELNPNNAEMWEALYKYERLYNNITNKPLQVIQVPQSNGWIRVQFAPNAEEYEYLTGLQNQILKLEKNRANIERKLKDYDALLLEKQACIDSITSCKNLILQQFLNYPEQLIPQSKSAAKRLANHLNKKIFEPFKTINKYINDSTRVVVKPTSAPTPENFKDYRPAFKQLVNALKGKETITLKDGKTLNERYFNSLFDNVIKVDTSKVKHFTENGHRISIPLKIDFKAQKFETLNKVERLSIMGYLIERKIINFQDLVSNGYKSLNDLLRLDNKAFAHLLENFGEKRLTISLGAAPNSWSDFYVVNDWIVDDGSVADVEKIISELSTFYQRLTHGALVQNKTFEAMMKTFNDETIVDYLMGQTEKFNEVGVKLVDNIREEEKTLKTLNKKIISIENRLDIPQLKNLQATYETGIYNPIVETRVGRLIDEFKKQQGDHLINLNLELESLIKECYGKIDIFQTRIKNLVVQITNKAFDLPNLYQSQLKALDWNFHKMLNGNDLRVLKSINEGKPVYVFELGGGNVSFSNTKPELGENFIKISSKLANDLIDFNDLRTERLKLLDERDALKYTAEEATIALEMNRNEFSYTIDGLKDLLNKETKRIADTVNAELLANLTPNFKNKALDESIQESQTFLNEKRKVLQRLENENLKLNEGLEKRHQEYITYAKGNKILKQTHLKELQKDLKKQDKLFQKKQQQIEARSQKLNDLQDKIKDEVKTITQQVEQAPPTIKTIPKKDYYTEQDYLDSGLFSKEEVKLVPKTFMDTGDGVKGVYKLSPQEHFNQTIKTTEETYKFNKQHYKANKYVKTFTDNKVIKLDPELVTKHFNESFKDFYTNNKKYAFNDSELMDLLQTTTSKGYSGKNIFVNQLTKALKEVLPFDKTVITKFSLDKPNTLVLTNDGLIETSIYFDKNYIGKLQIDASADDFLDLKDIKVELYWNINQPQTLQPLKATAPKQELYDLIDNFRNNDFIKTLRDDGINVYSMVTNYVQDGDDTIYKLLDLIDDNFSNVVKKNEALGLEELFNHNKIETIKKSLEKYQYQYDNDYGDWSDSRQILFDERVEKFADDLYYKLENLVNIIEDRRGNWNNLAEYLDVDYDELVAKVIPDASVVNEVAPKTELITKLNDTRTKIEVKQKKLNADLKQADAELKLLNEELKQVPEFLQKQVAKNVPRPQLKIDYDEAEQLAQAVLDREKPFRWKDFNWVNDEIKTRYKEALEETFLDDDGMEVKLYSTDDDEYWELLEDFFNEALDDLDNVSSPFNIDPNEIQTQLKRMEKLIKKETDATKLKRYKAEKILLEQQLKQVDAFKQGIEYDLVKETNPLFTKINEKIKTLTQERKAMLDQLNELQKEFKTLQQQLGEVDKTAELNKANQKIQKHNEKVKQQIAKVEEELTQLNQELKDVEKTSNDYQKQIQDLQKELNEMQNQRLKQERVDVLDKERYRRNQKQINELKQIVDERQSQLDSLLNWNTPLNYQAQKVSNMTDDLINNANNQDYIIDTPLVSADKFYANQYIDELQNSLKYVKEILSLDKIDFNTNQIFKNLLAKLPEHLQTSINRLANVQMSIHGQISRLYRDVYGIDMFNWNVEGFMRHILNVDAAQLTSAIKAVEGQLGLVEGNLFGRNMKKFALHREYQGSAYDVNKFFGSQLFNDNPVEVTALALELLPQSFSLGGVFKNLIDCKMIRKLPWVGDELNDKSLKMTLELLQQEVDKLNIGKKLNTFQQKTLNEYYEAIDTLKQIQELRASQKLELPLETEFNAQRTSLTEAIENLKIQLKQLKSKVNFTRLHQDNDAYEDLIQQIDDVKSQLNQKQQALKNIPTPDLEDALHRQYRDKLVVLYEKANPLITKFFKEHNAYAKVIGGIGPRLSDEYMLLDKTMINTIKNSFEGFSKASFDISDLKKIKQFKDNDWINQINTIINNLENGENYLIHKAMYEQIKRYTFNSNDHGMTVLFKLLQKYITIPFKKLSLLSIGFHARNLLTNYSNAYLAGINPVDLHKGMMIARREQTLFEEFLKTLNTKLMSGDYRSAEEQLQLIREMIKHDKNGKIFQDYLEMNANGIIGNNQFNSDIVELINHIKNRAMGIQGNLHFKFKNKLIQKPQEALSNLMSSSFQLSKHMDDYAKIAMYRLIKNEKKYQKLAQDLGFEGEKAAEKFVKFVLFDYNNLTFREETYMKALFPFYTWVRKNFEFQLRNFVINNKKYLRIFNALSGWRQGIVGDKDNEQDFYENYTPIWNENGEITYLKFNPAYDEVDRILDGSALVNNLTPLIKTPLEMITGYDFFTRKQFNTNGVLPGFGLGLNNLLGTFNVIQKMLFQNYTPTYEDKKLGGLIGKKLIDLINVSKNILAFSDNVRDNGLINAAAKLVPSAFSVNDIQMSRYYNAKERNKRLQKAVMKYLQND